MIPYGPFRPDAGGPNTGFASEANNVLVQSAGGGVGYGPMAGLSVAASATALSDDPRGNISLRLFDGTQKVYVATATTIEELQSDYTWTSIATGLAVTDGDDMSFLHFGSYLLNTNTTDGFNAFNVETPGTNDAVTGAPVARFIFACNNVVIALDCDGDNRRMQSSGVGDHTAWTTLGADGKTFEDGGALVGGVDLKNGAAVLFQDSAMRLMQFGNAPGGALYSINKIADGRGSVGARSIVSFDGLVFYLATDGFYRFDLGGGNQPIGAEKVNRWFLDRVDQSRLDNVQGAVDPLNKVVWWRYPTNDGASETVFADLIGYDWQIGEWMTATVETTALSRLATPGYTVDSADLVVDSTDLPVDSRYWQGGQPIFAALNADLKYGVFSGAPMEATLETCVTNNPTTGLIQWATPISDAPNSTLELGTSDSLSAAITWGSATSKGRAGRVPLRGRGMNVAFRETIPEGETWTYANGVDHIQSSQGGPK